MARPKEYVARSFPLEAVGPSHGRPGEMSEAFLIKCEEELSKLTERTARNLTDDMISLFESELHSDLTVTNGVNEVKAHKCLVQLRAKHVWQDDWMEHYVDDRGITRYVIKLRGCDGRRMREFIRQLYAVSDSGLLMEEHVHFFQGGDTGTSCPNPVGDSSCVKDLNVNNHDCELEPTDKDAGTEVTEDEQNGFTKAADFVTESVVNGQNSALQTTDVVTESVGPTTHIITKANAGDQNFTSQSVDRSSCSLSRVGDDKDTPMPNSSVENSHNLEHGGNTNGLLDLSDVKPEEGDCDSSQSFLNRRMIENGGNGIHDSNKEEDSLKAVVQNVSDATETACMCNGEEKKNGNLGGNLMDASLNDQEQNNFENVNGCHVLSPDLEISSDVDTGQVDLEHVREVEGDGECLNSVNDKAGIDVKMNSGAEGGIREVKEEASKEQKETEEVEKTRRDLSDVIKESYSLSVPYKCCSPLASNLLQMYLQEKDCDCCLSVDGVKFLVHKCVLSCRCEYFQAMLGGSWQESTTQMIPLEGVTAPAVEQLLLFLYGGVTELVTASDLFDLFVLADMYGVDSMKSLLVFYLKKDYCHFFHRPCSVCASTAADAINLCYSFNLGDVQDRCIRWMSKFFTKIWPTKSFSSLSEPVHQLCVQGMLSHMTEANVLDIIMECNKLTTTLPRVKWTEPILCLITQLMDSAIEFTSKNFTRVLKTEEFLAWGKVAAWKAGALEEIFNSVIDSLPVDTACAVYQTLENLKAFQVEMETEQDVLDLLDLMIKRCEKFLKTHILQVARSKPWSTMDKSIQDKILQKSSYFSLADYPGPKPKVKPPPKAERTRPPRRPNPNPDVRGAGSRNPRPTSARGRDAQGRKGDDKESGLTNPSTSQQSTAERTAGPSQNASVNKKTERPNSAKGDKAASAVLGQRKFTVGAQRADRPTSAIPKTESAISTTEKTKRSTLVNQKAERPASSNQKTERPASSNQKAARPASSNQQTERTASSNHKTERTASSNHKAERPASSNQKAERPASSNQKAERPASSNQKAEKPASSNQKAEKPAPSNQKAEKPASSNQKAEKPASSNQKAERPASCNQKTEKPASSNQTAERPASSIQKAVKPASSNQKAERETLANRMAGRTTNQKPGLPTSANVKSEGPAPVSTKAERFAWSDKKQKIPILSTKVLEKPTTSKQNVEQLKMISRKVPLTGSQSTERPASPHLKRDGGTQRMQKTDTIPVFHRGQTGRTDRPSLATQRHERQTQAGSKAQTSAKGKSTFAQERSGKSGPVTTGTRISRNNPIANKKSLKEISTPESTGGEHDQPLHESMLCKCDQSVADHQGDKCDLSVSESVVDTCGQPVSESVVDTCVQPVSESVVDTCGQPVSESVVDTCGQPVSESVSDICGQPVCESVADTCGQSAPESVVDTCGQPVSESVADICGQPLSESVVDTCGQPVCESVVDTCGQPVSESVVDTCGQPVCESVVDTCGQRVSESVVDTCGQRVSESGQPVSESVVDTCGQPVSESGQPVSESVVDSCGQPVSESGQPVSESGHPVSESVVDTCGEPVSESVVDTCGQPVSERVVDTCGQRVSESGQPVSESVVDTCVQPVSESVVDTCGQPVSESVVDSCGQPVSESGQPVSESGHPVSESVVDTCGEPVSESVVDTCGQPVSESGHPVSESVVDTCGQPVSENGQPVSESGQPVTESVVDTCGQPVSESVVDTCGQSDDALNTFIDTHSQSEHNGLSFDDLASMPSQSGCEDFFHPCGQSVSEGTIKTSECWAELNRAGQSLTEGEGDTSGQFDCDVGAGKPGDGEQYAWDEQAVNGTVSSTGQAVSSQEGFIPEEAVNSTSQSERTPQEEVTTVPATGKTEMISEPESVKEDRKDSQPISDIK